MTFHILPEDFKVYILPDGSVDNQPQPGSQEKVLPTVNQYTGFDGGYIACYSRNQEEGVYSVGDGIYVMGQIRLQGSYANRTFNVRGYENQDISSSQELNNLCNLTFPSCKGEGWAGGDTGGWFGLRQDPPDPRDKEIDIPVSDSLPATVDLREWCSSVKDQQPLNSCTAQSAAALVEYYIKKTSGVETHLSTLFLYKVTRNLCHEIGDVGADSRTTMKALAMVGIPPEAYWPYNKDKVNEEPPAFCYALASKNSSTKYYRLDPTGKPKKDVLQHIKTTLASGLPLMFTIIYYVKSWEQSFSNGGLVPYPSSSDWRPNPALGHNMAAVGYDDNMKIQNTDKDGVETTGAFLVKNSLGTKWGDKGYGWVPYDYLLKRNSVDWWTIMKQEWLDTGVFEPTKKSN